MKVNIPDELKAAAPPTQWGRILTATPVVMTVLATMLAGLASSEMTRAQYDRALGAQQQSKAGDQWSFFQAKRLRGAIQRNTFDLLQGTTEVRGLEPGTLRQAAEQLPVRANSDEARKVKEEMLAALESAAGQQAIGFLQRGEVPRAGTSVTPDPPVKAAMDAVEASRPEPEIAALLAPVADRTIEEALRNARDQAQALDAATKPINQAIDLLDNLLARRAACLQERPPGPVAEASAPRAGASLSRDFTAARLRYAAVRYETEARLNQAIANLYELQVRKSNISAERHHARSQRFFFGMLAAQMAVIIATLAIAARQRNLLWSLAAVAGLAAVALAIYVYVYV